MFKPLTQILSDRAGFGGSVYLPALPLPEFSTEPIPRIPVQEATPTGQAAPEQSASLLGIVLSRLSSLRPESETLKARLAASIAKLSDALQEADELVETCRVERLAILESRYDAIRVQGRKISSQLPGLEGDAATAIRRWHEAREARGQAESAVRARSEQRRGISPWSTNAEITAADNSVEQSKKALGLAIQREQAAMQESAAADTELERAHVALDELLTGLQRLDAEIAGLPYYDPGLGLATAPSV